MSPKTLIVALYKFKRLTNLEPLRERVEETCKELELMGTLILADEGLNGTLSGREPAIRAFLSFLERDLGLGAVEHKESWAVETPFLRMRVRLKREIVTMGIDGVSPERSTGVHVPPNEWNELISDPNVVLIDTRNNYETEIGTFPGATDPKTSSFSEFPDWVERNLDPAKDKKIAMFCTGGIRCEKASAHLKDVGFENVFQLQGGILKYLETIPAGENKYQGECFVFDQRVAVGHGVKQGSYDLCHGCRMPMSERDKEDPEYVAGVCCKRCTDSISEEKKQRSSERQKQLTLAGQRGDVHMGSKTVTSQRSAKRTKLGSRTDG